VSRPIRIALFAAGLLAMGILIERSGPTVLLAMLRRIGWNILIVIVLYGLHVMCRALALWRVVLGSRVRFMDVLRVRLAAETVEVLTATGPFLAEPAKGWLLTRRGLTPTEAFAAVATEYLLYTTLSAALSVSAYWWLASSGLLTTLRPAAIIITAIMAAFLGGVAFAVWSGIGLVTPSIRASGALIGPTRAARAATAFAPVEHVVLSFLHDHPARLVQVLAIQATGHALFIVEILIVIAALGVHLSVKDAVIIEGGAKVIGVAFFFIPGQVGASEAVYASLLTAVGLSASAGLTLALIRRLRSLCVASVGLFTATRFSQNA
jgi:hypothetical protein